MAALSPKPAGEYQFPHLPGLVESCSACFSLSSKTGEGFRCQAAAPRTTATSARRVSSRSGKATIYQAIPPTQTAAGAGAAEPFEKGRISREKVYSASREGINPRLAWHLTHRSLHPRQDASGHPFPLMVKTARPGPDAAGQCSTVVPCPSPLCTDNSPPCSLTIRRTISMPSPVPVFLVVNHA